MNMFKSILFVCLFFASSLDQSMGLTVAPSSPSKMCANTSVCVKMLHSLWHNLLLAKITCVVVRYLVLNGRIISVLSSRVIA